MRSEVLCSIPWTSLYLSSAGGWAPCCVSKLQVSGTPDQAFYSAEIQAVREDLSRGFKSPSCSTCWKKEENSGRSMRQGYAEMFGASSAPSEVRTQDITYLDVSFSNICNLKCRFCGPDRSHKWISELKNLRAKNPSFWERQLLNSKTLPLPSPEEIVAFIRTLPALHTLNINGGEPFADPRHHRFLEALIEDGAAERLRILYTSNGTRAPERELELLEKFKNVEIMFSVEGTGDLYRYIRGDHFSLEEHVTQNIIRFAQIPHAKLGIHSTMSIYNAWALESIHLWKKEMEKTVGPLMWQIGVVASPSCLSPYVISFEERERIASSLPITEPVFRKWKSMLLARDVSAEFRDGSALGDFFQYSRDLDEIRGESLEKSAPQLYQYLHSHD